MRSKLEKSDPFPRRRWKIPLRALKTPLRKRFVPTPVWYAGISELRSFGWRSRWWDDAA